MSEPKQNVMTRRNSFRRRIEVMNFDLLFFFSFVLFFGEKKNIFEVEHKVKNEIVEDATTAEYKWKQDKNNEDDYYRETMSTRRQRR